MPVKFGRVGLGESPWEHVRAHVFEWEHEGRVRGQNRKRQSREKAGHKKRRCEKTGHEKRRGATPPASQVKPTGGQHPASCL